MNYYSEPEGNHGNVNKTISVVVPKRHTFGCYSPAWVKCICSLYNRRLRKGLNKGRTVFQISASFCSTLDIFHCDLTLPSCSLTVYGEKTSVHMCMNVCIVCVRAHMSICVCESGLYQAV